jgi:hypothetical protein
MYRQLFKGLSLSLTTDTEIADTVHRATVLFLVEKQMANNDYLRQTLEHYREQRMTQLDQVRKTEALIAHLERELGEAPTVDSGQSQTPIEYPTAIELRSSAPRTIQIEPDDFYGMTQTQAAKAYLQRVKRAVSLDQIVEALRNGGAQVGGADPKKTLYVALARNPSKEFVVPREGYIGLREFYPTLPKASSKPKNHKGKKGRKRPRKASPQKSKAVTSTKDGDDKPIKAAVHKALSDGPRSLSEIIESVEKILGRKVSKIGVNSTLRGKDFVKEGDKYKSVAK